MYVCMYVGMSTKNTYVKCVGGITWPKHAHAQSVLGSYNGPVTPVLFISTTR